jgi:hypothetical protein
LALEEFLACDTCEIALVREAAIIEPSVDAAIRRSTKFRQGADNRVILAPLGERDRIGIRAPHEQHVTVFGRGGEGPQEFRRVISAANDFGDSLIVLSDGKIAKFSPALAFLRTARVPGLLSDFIVPRPGRIVASSYAAPGRPFLVLNDEFQAQAWLGDSSRSSDQLEHRMAPDGIGGFWAVQTLPPHRVSRYDSNGVKVAEWLPNAAWERAEESLARERGVPESLRRTPRVNGIYYDRTEDQLWLGILLSDPDWKPEHQAATQGREGPATTPDPDAVPHRIYDSMIEVRNASTGVLVASRRLPGPVAGISDRGLLYVIAEEPEEGHLFVMVFQPMLERGNSGTGREGNTPASPQ